MTDEKKKTQMPTVAEALKAIQDGGKPVRLVHFQPALGHFAMVPSASKNDALNTHQQHAHDGARTMVRTEYKTILPLHSAQFASLKSQAAGAISAESVAESASVAELVSVELAFAIVTVYEFDPDDAIDRRMVYAKYFGIQHTYPYWRTFTQMSTSLLGVMPSVVALLRPEQVAAMAGFIEAEPAQDSSPTASPPPSSQSPSASPG